MPFIPWTGTIKWPKAQVLEEAIAVVPSRNLQIIPVDSSPNQSFDITVLVDGENRGFHFFIYWNEMAGYWVMDLSNSTTGEYYVVGVPMVCGINLLHQVRYMGIGSACVIPLSTPAPDHPQVDTLGISHALVWSDTP